jgi:hypothetical protein
MLGLCVAVVFAVAAVGATSASALPEWGKCEAQAGGKYKDAGCTEKAKKGAGAYEWKKGTTLKPDHFSGENVGSGGVLSTQLYLCEGENENVKERRISETACKEGGGSVGKFLEAKIECESEHNTGEAVGKNKVASVSVRFRGCKLFGSAPCSNGPEEGEIQVNPLKGELGYINKSEKKVGLLLEPFKKGGAFALFNCAGVLSTGVGVGSSKEGAWYKPESHGGYDGIISPITPVNQMTTKYEQVYTVNPETFENIPSKFEGKHIELLEDYTYNSELPRFTTMWSPSGEEITNVNTSEEEGEIKA